MEWLKEIWKPFLCILFWKWAKKFYIFLIECFPPPFWSGSFLLWELVVVQYISFEMVRPVCDVSICNVWCTSYVFLFFSHLLHFMNIFQCLHFIISNNVVLMLDLKNDACSFPTLLETSMQVAIRDFFSWTYWPHISLLFFWHRGYCWCSS